MPNEVINTIRQLAAACNKYKGIVFTDKEGNVVNDENDDTEDNVEITGVNEDKVEITGVDDYSPPEEAYSPPEEIYGPSEEIYSPSEITQENTFITGVGQNYIHQHQNNDNSQDYEQGHDNDIDIANDDILFKGELPEETYMTIADISIIREKNVAQMNIDPETREERNNEAIPNTHQYNLRPRPTRRNHKYAIAQINNQLTMSKPHAHVMMTQMNIREGIKQFGERGNEALLKEF